jgi:hypothetical protein
MAGGTLPQHAGPGEAVFANNSFASMGDLGSEVLKPAPSGTIWTVGTSVKVSWGIRYNVRRRLSPSRQFYRAFSDRIGAKPGLVSPRVGRT